MFMVSSKVAGWSWGYLMTKRFINIDNDTRKTLRKVIIEGQIVNINLRRDRF